MEEGKFLRIKCPRCRHPQITFGKASTRLKCRSCNLLLIKPRGGKPKIKAQIQRVL